MIGLITYAFTYLGKIYDSCPRKLITGNKSIRFSRYLCQKFNLTDEEMDEGYDKERVSSLDQFLEDNEIDR